MPALHYRVHILEISDHKTRLALKQARRMHAAVLEELDQSHWLIDGRSLAAVEKVCAKAGISLTVALHG